MDLHDSLGRITRANFATIRDDLEGYLVEVYCHEPNFQRLDRVEGLAAEKGKSVPQIALAWVLNQPLDIFAVPIEDKTGKCLFRREISFIRTYGLCSIFHTDVSDLRHMIQSPLPSATRSSSSHSSGMRMRPCPLRSKRRWPFSRAW